MPRSRSIQPGTPLQIFIMISMVKMRLAPMRTGCNGGMKEETDEDAKAGKEIGVVEAGDMRNGISEMDAGKIVEEVIMGTGSEAIEATDMIGESIAGTMTTVIGGKETETETVAAVSGGIVIVEDVTTTAEEITISVTGEKAKDPGRIGIMEKCAKKIGMAVIRKDTAKQAAGIDTATSNISLFN